MEVKVKLNNLRIAPRKVRLVADLIRNKSVVEARSLLEFTVKKPAGPLLKLLNSAVASALHDFKLQESRLYVHKINVDEGSKLKRFFPMSRGRAYPIMKRTSHITLVLGGSKESKKQEGMAGKKIKNANLKSLRFHLKPTKKSGQNDVELKNKKHTKNNKQDD